MFEEETEKREEIKRTLQKIRDEIILIRSKLHRLKMREEQEEEISK